jgi:imidazole glycerol-phosphate synthase subunit HisH
MIAIVDYEMGNLRSVEKAFQLKGCDVKITDDLDELASAGGMIIPGVGAFPDAMKNLHAKGLVEPIRRHAASGKPLLGICLGMQVLFEEGFEGDRCEGLGLLPGRIVKIPGGVKIPHMGWNRLSILRESPMLKGTEEGSYVYFVHSYYAE